MTKTIFKTIGAAVMAALLCVTCGDSGLDRSPTNSGDVDGLLDRLHGKPDNNKPADTTGGGTPTTPTVKTYTLNVGRNIASGGSVSRNPSKTAYDAGETVTVTATPYSDYGFTGWSGAANGTTNPVIIKMDGNKTLTANFEWQGTTPEPTPVTRYELAISAKPATGGSVSLDPDYSDYEEGAQVTATAAAFPGYRFTGWSGAATETTNSVTITMNGNKTLTAEFAQIYTVTFNANGGNALTPNTDTTDTDGKLASLPEPTRNGYAFNGWYTAAEGGSEVTVNRVYTANTTIYAQWTANPITPPQSTVYTVTFNYNYSGSTNTTATTGADGKLASLPTPTRSGYDFNGWWTAATGGDSVHVGKAYSENTVIYAKWTINNYTVTFNSQSGSAVSSQSIGHGNKATKPTDPTRASYTFGGWYKESACTNAWDFTADVVTFAITLYAKWNREYDVFTDTRDSKIYKKVEIGEQTWMAENLNYDGKDNGGGEIGKCYDNNPDNCTKYGRLYNWSTALNGASSSSEIPSGVQGICPAGWHLPSEAEWVKLTNFVGGAETAGPKLKSADGWNNKDANGTDDYGFLALPSGTAIPWGTDSTIFNNIGTVSYLWSATSSENGSGARVIGVTSSAKVTAGNHGSSYLYSVRCVEN